MLFQQFLAKALYNNNAESLNELSFHQADILTVLEVDTHGVEGWYMCSLGDKVGIVAANRLQRLRGSEVDSMDTFFSPTNKDDEEIYDDATVATRPIVAQKPSVKNVAALFEKTIPAGSLGGAGAPAVRPKPSRPSSNTNNTPSKPETQISPQRGASVKKYGIPIPSSSNMTQLKHVPNGVHNKNSADISNGVKPHKDIEIVETSKPDKPLNTPAPGQPGSITTASGKIALKPTGGKLNIPNAFTVASTKTDTKPPIVLKKTSNQLPPALRPTSGGSIANTVNQNDVVTSSSDQKYRLKNKLCVMNMSKCPPKPASLDVILDFSRVTANAKDEELPLPPPPVFDEDDQETYDDVGITAPLRPKAKPPLERVVSLIPELTAEEEGEEETYDDAGSPSNDSGIGSTSQDTTIIEEEGEELYEPLDEVHDMSEEQKRNEERERKEAERRDREEKKKDKEKQKKMEKEKKALQSKFKIDGTEPALMDGDIRTACKGGKVDLAVKAGETVHIVRLQDNPAGKFLVKNSEGKFGYVDMANIEIKQSQKDKLKMSISEETYDDTGMTEDIYEETN